MSVLSRIIAAVVGGFAFTSAVIILLPLLLPGSRTQWVLWSTLSGFALWTGAVVWVFAARSVARAWAGLAVATAIPALAVVIVQAAAP